MEIQRQSDYYSLDRPEVHRANLTSEQIRDMTSGPSIPTGMLNTRTASRDEEEEDALWDSFNYELCPECGQDADKHVMGRDTIIGKPHLYCTAAFGGDAITPAPWLVGDEEEEDEDYEGEAAPQVLPPEFGEAVIRALVRKHLGRTADIQNKLLQAEGEEIEGIGQYLDFLDEARGAGDADATAVIEEAISDEQDHVRNIGEVLQREASPAALLTRLAPMLLSMGGDGGGALDQTLGDISGAESKAAFDRAAEEAY